MEYITPPGWAASPVAAGEALAKITPCKVGDGALATVDASGQAVLIDPLDGSVKRRLGNPNGVIPTGSMLRSEGDSLFVSMSSPAKVEVDVCNLTTGEWRPRVSGEVPLNRGSSPVALFYQQELRVITASGILLRWKVDDLTPLETRSYPTGSVNFRTVGTAFGDSFCAGFTDGGLVMEKDGVWSVKSFPSNTSVAEIYPKMIFSESWMALEIVTSGSGRGVMVWDKKMPGLSPSRKYYSTGHPPVSPGAIVQDRYLLQQVKGPDSPYINTLRVIDLRDVFGTPLSFPLDMGNPFFTRMIGMSGDHFWMYEKNTTASALPSNGQVLKSRLVTSTVFTRVNVANATVSEGAGPLQFKITADRLLYKPITVELSTRDGTARGGSDYTPWSGTVTLTPASPTATVSIAVLTDKKLETYESVFLDVRSCTGAWHSDSSATGFIWDSQFRKLPALPRLPGEVNDWEFYDWALVPSGVVKYATITVNHKRSYHAIRARPGDKSWQFLKAPLFPDGRGKVVDTLGDVVCFAETDDLSYGRARVVDVSTDRLLGNYKADGGALALSDQGMVILRTGTPRWLDYYRFDKPGSPVWSKLLTTTSDCHISRYGNGLFIHSDVGGALYVRNFSDGSIVRVIQPRIGEYEPVPVVSTGDDSLIVTNAPDFSSVGSPPGTNIGPVAVYSWPYRDPWIAGSGVTGHGVGWYPAGRLDAEWDEPGYVTALVDRASGVKVGEIKSMREIRPVHATDGMIAYTVPHEGLEILQTWMPLPEPTAKLAFTAEESDTPHTFEFNLATAVDFPITATVVSASSDIRAMAPVVVKAGSTKVRISVTVVRDSIPEDQEVFPITVLLSGDGAIRNHAVTVTVPANDHLFLKKPNHKAIIPGTSAALHPSGLAIGNVPTLFAGDYRYEIAYPPDRNLKRPKPFFGAAVALDKKWLAVGAPFLNNADKGRKKDYVFVYDRKSGKEIYQFSGKSFHQSFGSVLRFDKGRLVVGAPGWEQAGSVSLFHLDGNGKQKTFTRPGELSKTAGFGWSVALRGNYLWVAAPRDNQGRVFQFDVRTGKLVREIKAPAGYQAFGHAMEIIGSRLAVSAPRLDGTSAVFLYNINNGKAAGRIDCPFPDGGAFGASLAVLPGKQLLVGCPRSKFSPTGGLLLYDLSNSSPAFLTMFCPPRPKESDDNYPYLNLGATASLSSAEDFVAIVTGPRRDLLAFQKDTGNEVLVIQIDTPGKNKKPAAPVAPASAPLAISPEDPWEKALGAGACADDCPVQVSTAAGRSTIVLPQITSLEPGARLLLERSSDLAKWNPVAVLEGEDATWVSSIEGVSIDGLTSRMELPVDSPSAYFRIRCEAP